MPLGFPCGIPKNTGYQPYRLYREFVGLIIAVPALTMISGESHSGSTLPSYVTNTSSNVSQLSSVPAPKRSTYSNTGTGQRASVGNALPARVDGDDNMNGGEDEDGVVLKKKAEEVRAKKASIVETNETAA